MLALIAIFLVLYLSTGAVLARGDYARRLKAAGSRDIAAELVAKRRAIRDIRHSRDCWCSGQYGDNHGYACDCSHRAVWDSLRKQVVALEAGVIRVSGPYPMFFAWPAMGLHNFLTNGSVKERKGYNPALTARLERDLLELEG